MWCTDERCNSSEALAACQMDSNHCINGCPYEAHKTDARMANAVDVDPDVLATYMARHPDRVNAAMRAAFMTTNAR